MKDLHKKEGKERRGMNLGERLEYEGCRMRLLRDRWVDSFHDRLRDESGIGVVEIILILVVLIALVLIFKEQLTSLVEDIFDTITNEASSV